jgi:microcystin-dependent protein
MAQPFVGEIRMFGGNFAPVGWAICNGALMAIDQNPTLFNLIGTTYGGDGQTTFALPDLQGRLPMHVGFGALLGLKGGVETVTLTTVQIPAHSHAANASTLGAPSRDPAGKVWAAWNAKQFSDQPSDGAMNAGAIGSAGGSQPHDNMVPFLVINFIISLFGIFPTQT